MTLPSCALCGQRCIPLADYDAPICVACDNLHEAATTRLLITELANARSHGARRPRVTPAWVHNAPLSDRAGPADPADLAALIEAISPSRRAA